MKRSIAAILAASSLSIAAATYTGLTYAGEHGHHGGKHNSMRGLMFERALDLTAEQKASVDEIYSDAKQQRKASSTERRDVRQAMMDLNPADADYQAKVATIAKQQAAQVEQRILAHAAVQAQIFEILTPEQREQLMELKQDAKQHAGKRHQRGGDNSK